MLLDPGDHLLGLLDPRPDRRAQEDAELALVGRGEELGPDERHQRRGSPGSTASTPTTTTLRWPSAQLEHVLVPRVEPIEERLAQRA